jgi:hypothetical protein
MEEQFGAHEGEAGARISRTLLAEHAPYDWEQDYELGSDQDLGAHAVPMVVLAVSLRSITAVQTEAVRFERYAMAMSRFIDVARRAVRGPGRGFFDRFTGRGFLAYWIPRTRGLEGLSREQNMDRYRQAQGAEVARAFQTAHLLSGLFDRDILPLLRENSRNFPPDVGLSLGLDTGSVFMAVVAGNVTLLGTPVVGAVRMMQASNEPGELIANLTLESFILSSLEFALPGIPAVRTARPTKEAPEGQPCFSIALGGA